jgi:uncharacterized FlaG/YvyC family protein
MRGSSLDEILDLLDKTTKRNQKTFEECKETAQRQTNAYEQIIQNKDSTEEQRLKAFMGRMIAYDRLDRLSSQLSLLYTLQIFAFKVKVLEVSVDKIEEQISKSEALKILVEAQYESL